MNPKYYIACDLGAESGRVMLGRLEEGRLTLEEMHRFPSAAVRVLGSWRWDVLRIFEELKTGLRNIAGRHLPVASMSVDSWGVDYVLINAVHPMLSPPFHYRDARTESTYQKVREQVGSELIFAETGIQFMPINTIYHLASDLEKSRALLDVADCFLTIGDYFNYLFSGVPRVDESNASTTQLYNPRTRSWSQVLIERCGFPPKIFPQLVPPGTVLGPLLPEVASETGLSELQVVATCSHDTGAAVAAVPAEGEDDWAYLSSGTWSLLGLELPQPLISEKVREHNFTNEAGYGGTTRFLKNIVGLWILQESRREWARQGLELDYATLTREAENAEPFRSLIDPRAARFSKPGEMPQKIAALLFGNGPAGTGKTGPVRALHFREPRAALPRHAGRDRAIDRTHHPPVAHRGWRQPKRALKPICRQRHRASGRRRSGGGHRDRQRASPGHRARSPRFTGRPAPARAPFFCPANL